MLQAAIALQRLPQFRQHRAELPGHGAFRIVDRAQQGGPRPLPQSVQPIADRRIGQQFQLHRLHFLAQGGIVLQRVSQFLQPFFHPPPQRVVGLHGAFGQQLVHAIQHGIGDPCVQPGQLEQAVGPLRDHRADEFFVFFQRAPNPADAALHHGKMPPVGDCRADHLADQRSHFDLVQLAAQPFLHQAAEAVLVERAQHIPEQPSRTIAQALFPGSLLRQEAPNRCRKVHTTHAAGHDLRGEEVLPQEHRHSIGNAILVLGDDRRVRDRQPQRATKQRRYREPVRQSADHRRLGERQKIAPGGMQASIVAGNKKQPRHQDEQAGGCHPHAAEALLSRERGRGSALRTHSAGAVAEACPLSSPGR